MVSFASAVGLRSGPVLETVPNYGPYFLFFGFFWVNVFTTARTMKQYYGIDSNISPREDIARFADAAIKSGKLTRSQLDRIKRNEAAHANAYEAWPSFVGAVVLATVARVPNQHINRACLLWTVSRIGYHIAYLAIGTGEVASLTRTGFWYASGWAVLSLLWQSGKLLNQALG